MSPISNLPQGHESDHRSDIVTEKDTILQLDQLFDRERVPLSELVSRALENSKRARRVGRALRKQTGKPVRFGSGLLVESPEEADCIDLDLVGDFSFRYEIVLNAGVKQGLDFDAKLAQRCKGPVHMCWVWVSLLLPCYTIDTFDMAYTNATNQWEFSPHTPSKGVEQRTLNLTRTLMSEHGYSRVTKKLARLKVPKATTDCCRRGEATVFDCLFSDTQDFHCGIVRCTHLGVPGVYPGSKVGWREHIGDRGQVLEKYTWREFRSGDWVTTYLDSKARVTKVKVVRKVGKQKREMVLDVEKRLRRKC